MKPGKNATWKRRFNGKLSQMTRKEAEAWLHEVQNQGCTIYNDAVRELAGASTQIINSYVRHRLAERAGLKPRAR